MSPELYETFFPQATEFFLDNIEESVINCLSFEAGGDTCWQPLNQLH